MCMLERLFCAVPTDNHDRLIPRDTDRKAYIRIAPTRLMLRDRLREIEIDVNVMKNINDLDKEFVSIK
jgi:hypothetical protein